MIALFVGVAILLVALGGWLAAADAALGVLSRADLHELAQTSRARRQLTAIASDIGAHINAVNFMRVVAETTAAVLVTLAFAAVFPQWWWVLLLSAFIMTLASFVLVGASPRAVGRRSTPVSKRHRRVFSVGRTRRHTWDVLLMREHAPA